MRELFNQIKSRMNELPTLAEENIKNHVVVPIFLRELGYDTLKLDYETNVYAGRTDITYYENGKPLIVIETKGLGLKNKETRITDKDKKQLIDYLIGRKERTVWGILTNGTDYYLFNDDIRGLIDDKIVFHISINQNSDWKYLTHFSYESIFVNKSSNFFADIARFKMYRNNSDKKESSFEAYQSTLYNFFRVYSQNHHYSSLGKTDIECLCQIQLADFFDYARKMNECPSKKLQNAERAYSTLVNNYNHLKAFFETLKNYGDIPHHNFNYSEKEVLKVFESANTAKDKHILDAAAYQIILEYLYKGRNAFRNIAIFMLCSYYGMKRSAVNKLTWDSINLGKNTITVENRKYKMTKLMRTCLQALYDERTQQRLKCKEVFASRYIKGGKSLSEGAINDVFYSLRKIDVPSHDFQWVCPEKVRECLIQSLFDNGYSIESIAYYTGLDLSSIASCLSYDKIVEVGKKRLDKPCKKPIHPFQEAVDNFYNANIAGEL